MLLERILFVDILDHITPQHLRGFFVGWPNPPSPEAHYRLLHNSDEVVLAIDPVTGDVVGFITAVTDHVLAAYIPLLEVLPAYQAQGIGSELVRRMLAKLRHLYAIDLMCDPKLQPFYARFGMMSIGGMALRHYDRQAGSMPE